VPFLSTLEVVYDNALHKSTFTLLYFTTTLGLGLGVDTVTVSFGTLTLLVRWHIRLWHTKQLSQTVLFFNWKMANENWGDVGDGVVVTTVNWWLLEWKYFAS